MNYSTYPQIIIENTSDNKMYLALKMKLFHQSMLNAFHFLKEKRSLQFNKIIKQ